MQGPQIGCTPRRDILVLHDGVFQLPGCKGCTVVSVESVPRLDQQFDGVIVVGHSQFPTYLGLEIDEFAYTLSRVLRDDADFVLLDTCWGAQAELLSGLNHYGALPKVFVAAPTTVPTSGYSLDDAMTGSDLCIEDFIITHRQELSTVRRSGFADLGAFLDHIADNACAIDDASFVILDPVAVFRTAAPGVDGSILVHLPRLGKHMPPGERSCQNSEDRSHGRLDVIIFPLILLAILAIILWRRSYACRHR